MSLGLLTLVDGTVDDEPEGEVVGTGTGKDDKPERQEGESSNIWASVAEVKCTVGTGTGTVDESTKVKCSGGTVDASID